jgi:hypothetical protein
MRHAAIPVLVVLAVLLSLGSWTGPVPWDQDPDALFYQAQLLEIQGSRQDQALRQVFSEPISAPLRRADLEQTRPGERRFTNPAWVDYSKRQYRRRWVVPLMAAALFPVDENRRLFVVSLLGYVAIAPLLYLLLRRRFTPGTSFVVTAACLLLPPLRWYSFLPMTESWGVAVTIGALLALALVAERGLRWLPLWIAAVVAVSFTRDTTPVPILAALALLLLRRNRDSAVVAAAGIAAALPAPLLFGGSVRENLAYNFDDFHPPPDASWGFVLREYPSNLWKMVHHDLFLPHDWGYPAFEQVAWYAGGLLALAGVVVLVVAAPWRDPFFVAMRGALAGSVAALLLTASPSSYRVELVLLPSLAVGAALLVERVRGPMAQRIGRARASPRPGPAAPAAK